MRKFQTEINTALKNRKIVETRSIDRKTYFSAKAYNAVMENGGDLRYNYYYKHRLRWPGGELDSWLSKMPIEVNGNIWDYGSGMNKLENMISMNTEMYREYNRYHLPNLDHYPIPDSDGGPRIFSNLRIVSEGANESRGNCPANQIDTQIMDFAANYGYKAILKPL